MKRKLASLLIIFFLILSFFISCNDEDKPQVIAEQQQQQQTAEQGETQEEPEEEEEETPSTPVDYTKWDNTYAKYKIKYNSKTKKFETDCPYVSFIEKEEGKDFVILNLTDIQISLESLKETNEEVILFKDTFETLVEQYKPNLITITGDFGDYSELSQSLEYIADYIDSFNIPWAPVFGNHDNETLDMSDKSDYLEGCKNCLFKRGATDLATLSGNIFSYNPALGNYVVNIVEGSKLINSLIFMNTGNKSNKISLTYDSSLTSTSYGFLSSKQIEWYEWAISSAQDYNKDVKSSLFIHIPIYEYAKAICAALKGTHSVKNKSELFEYSYTVPLMESTDDKYWNTGYEDSFGVIYDDAVATPRNEDNVFASILKMKSTNLVVSGHDHSNNTVINQKGVQLVYATKTGKGCYWHEGLTGGTIIDISATKTKVTQVIYNPGSPIQTLSN